MRKHQKSVFAWITFALFVLPLTVMAGDNSRNDTSDVINLDEIIISATRSPADLDDTPASSSIVPEEQIRSSTAVDLGDLLGTTNILSILDYGPGGLAMASMRGSSTEQVLILVDGQRINDARSGGVDLDNVPITYAKRIEVVRGGQSAMYGADAVGGIINIVTRRPAGTRARAWSTLGAYDSVSWGVEASRQFKAVSGLLSFSRMGTEGDFPFEDKYGRELIRENAGYTKRNVFGRLEWDISDSAALRLSGDHYYSDKGDPGPIGQYSPDASKRDKSNGLRADLEQSLRESISYKLSVYRRDATLRYINPQQPYPVDDTHKTNSVGTELQVRLLQDTKTPLIWGIDLKRDDITSTALGDRERSTYSGYVQQEFGMDLHSDVLHLSRIAIFPALRWDHYSDFQAGVSPKLGFLASFGRYRAASIKANVGSSYRAPTMNELYWPPDAFSFGNPDLRPERSRNLDVGLHVNLSEPSVLPELSMIRCAISYFWNSFRDRIQWTPGADGKWSPQNLSEARSTGLEAEARAQISPWGLNNLLGMGVSYTFLRAEDMLGRQLLYRPRHSLGYVLRAGTGKLWAQIQGIHHTRRYYTVQNTKWLEPFMKHDLQLGVERGLLSTATIGLVFEIRNIFDTRYQLAADYPLPGREWSIKTSIDMGGE